MTYTNSNQTDTLTLTLILSHAWVRASDKMTRVAYAYDYLSAVGQVAATRYPLLTCYPCILINLSINPV